MATKRLKKRDEFNLVEHLTRSIGEMMREMGKINYEVLEVESPKVAREYHINGVSYIRARNDYPECNGLMPYLVSACGDKPLYWDSKTMTPKQLINVHNYVVYAYNKYVDEYNWRHYLKG